jgi:hypothetical protein
MRRLVSREKRLLILFGILVGVAVYAYIPRPWSPTIVIETKHYTIRSSATLEQTREIGRVAEVVHSGYLQLMESLGLPILPHSKLEMKLFKDRREFRRCNRFPGWAEAFYRRPCCYQYYSTDEVFHTSGWRTRRHIS